MALITEEMLLKKFNGDRAMAAAFAEAYVYALEQTNQQLEKDFNPNSDLMRGIFKEFNDEFDWFTTPWWKKVLIKIGLR